MFLLEPNIKRSQGTLRDLQLIRWIGFVRYGTQHPRELLGLGRAERGRRAGRAARPTSSCLRLRNEMHFHAGKAGDVLNRAEQLRIAELQGYQPQGVCCRSSSSCATTSAIPTP